MCRLFLLLTLVPFAELFLIVAVHQAVARQVGMARGFAFTFGTILVTGLLGALLARTQGVRAFAGLREALGRGQFPDRELMDAACIVAGGAMLLMPGYLTDALGFTLLIPQTRALYRRLILGWFRRKIERGEARLTAHGLSFGGPPPDAQGPAAGDVVIDVTPPEPPR